MILRPISLLCIAFALAIGVAGAADAGQKRPVLRYLSQQLDTRNLQQIAPQVLPQVLPQNRFAQSCLSAAQARRAVQTGRALPLSSLINAIRAAAGGQILPQPQLCQSGGRLVYLINVLTGNGQVRALTVDAGSGSILGY